MTRNKNDLISSTEASNRLGITQDYIRKLIVKGKVKAKKLGRTWAIYSSSLLLFKRRRLRKEKEL